MTQRLFQRHFEITIGAGGETFVVKPPFRASFSVDKSIAGGLNKANLQIYGLKESRRLALVKDPEQQLLLPITIAVGYNGEAKSIFKGTVYKGSNDRGGSDFISTLECFDGGYDFFNSYTNKVVTQKSAIVDAVLADMPNTQRGKITEQLQLTRPKILVGASVDVLRETLQVGETLYIEDGRVNIIKGDEVTGSFIPVVSAATGLINTPERANQLVTFETLFNPNLLIGQRCELRSKLAPHLNGTYRIETINYTGDSEGEDWKQTVTAVNRVGLKVL